MFSETDYPYVELWDVAAGEMKHSLYMGGPGESGWVAFSPDGETLATGCWGVKLWDVASGGLKAKLDRDSGRRVNCVAFSPNGKLLAAGIEDRVVRLWDMPSTRKPAR